MNAVLAMMCVAGMMAVGQDRKTIFNAPGIQVKTSIDDGKEYSFLLYNRVYLGRQYHKSKDMPDVHRLPTTYFHDKSPIGVVMQDAKSFPEKDAPPVAVLGMDIGTMASYAKHGQAFHFTERVPAFVKLSLPDKGDKRYFSFVQDAMDRGAKVKIFEGEPREMIEKNGADKFYQVIIVETYKTPVVEIHKELLTKEALAMLMSKVREDGIVAFHTSNRYYQMAPIIASACNELKFACIVGKDSIRFDAQKDSFRYSSEWVMVARDAKHLAHLKKDDANHIEWHPPRVERITRGKLVEKDVDKELLWTDKGEQSFRGLYYSDPDIDIWHDILHDAEDWMRNRIGIGMGDDTTSKVTQSIHNGIRVWSEMSANVLNQPAPKKKSDKN